MFYVDVKHYNDYVQDWHIFSSLQQYMVVLGKVKYNCCVLCVNEESAKIAKQSLNARQLWIKQ